MMRLIGCLSTTATFSQNDKLTLVGIGVVDVRDVVQSEETG